MDNRAQIQNQSSSHCLQRLLKYIAHQGEARVARPTTWHSCPLSQILQVPGIICNQWAKTCSVQSELCSYILICTHTDYYSEGLRNDYSGTQAGTWYEWTSPFSPAVHCFLLRWCFPGLQTVSLKFLLSLHPRLGTPVGMGLVAAPFVDSIYYLKPQGRGAAAPCMQVTPAQRRNILKVTKLCPSSM